MNWFLRKEAFKEWLKQATEGAVFLGEEALCDSDAKGLPILPPKMYLFPQTEEMFNFCHCEDEIASPHFVQLAMTRKDHGKVIFGVKPCDMAGVCFSDEFYMGREFCDPYYKARRERVLFISMVCLKPDAACFCKGAWGGPFMKKCFDIQLTDLGEGFFVEAGSKKAQELVKNTERFFSRPSAMHAEQRKSLEKQVAGRSEKAVDLQKAALAIKNKAPEFWQKWADVCIQCGGCTYVCPTCYCFSAEDRGSARFRFWDSCMFEGYSRMAGGHNPRGKKRDCFRRFFEHKLNDYPLQFNKTACVGCGRCQITCPTDIGIANISIMLNTLPTLNTNSHE